MARSFINTANSCIRVSFDRDQPQMNAPKHERGEHQRHRGISSKLYKLFVAFELRAGELTSVNLEFRHTMPTTE